MHEEFFADELAVMEPEAKVTSFEVRAAPPSPVTFGVDTASVAGNGKVDWGRAKREGQISFAILRASYGTTPDKAFARNWPQVAAAGLVRGAYLFLRFPRREQVKSPYEQAQAFVKTVGKLEASDLPPALDVEFPGGRAATQLSAAQCLSGVRAAWKVLRDAYGVAPIIYTSARVWQEDLSNLPAPDLIESPLWVTRYLTVKRLQQARVSPALFAAGQLDPRVPKPWGDADNWWFHQYQGDAVKLPGFPRGDVDMNRFNPMVLGAAGERVKWVQRRVGVAESGVFDAATASALSVFKKQNGLIPEAIVDLQTFALLSRSVPRASNGARPPSPAVSNGSAAPTAGPLQLVAVESPGGDRIADKRDPSPADLLIVSGVGKRKVPIHIRAAQALAAMQSAAWQSGISRSVLLPSSGYRSKREQARLFAQAEKNHPGEATKWCARPGHSAHQSGRAIDIYLGAPFGSAHIKAQKATPAHRWLLENAKRFGFYPYPVEPWHWEYNPPAKSIAAVRADAGPVAAHQVTSQNPSLAGKTHYFAIPLGSEAPAPPQTGVFVPPSQPMAREVDVILYLHGFKYRSQGNSLVFEPKLKMEQYWGFGMRPRVPLREGVQSSGKRVILIAPTLGAKSEPGALARPGGLDAYLGAALRALGASAGWQGTPTLRHLVIAAHSGSGVTMRRLALGKDRALSHLRECWGYDCFYSGEEDVKGWHAWARKNPDKVLYAYHATKRPRQVALAMKNLQLKNLVPLASQASHFGTLTEHWRERIAACASLSP